MPSLAQKVNSGPFAALPINTTDVELMFDASAPAACLIGAAALALGVAGIGATLGAGLGVAAHASFLCG